MGAETDLPKHLTDDERALYEHAGRTRRSIREMLESLGPRDARIRAAWRAADDEAAAIQLVLEWEALKRVRGGASAPASKGHEGPAEDARAGDQGDPRKDRD